MKAASIAVSALVVLLMCAAVPGAWAAQEGSGTAAITFDYPVADSLFPPDIAAPQFLWRDAGRGNTQWTGTVTFADGGAPLVFQVKAEWMKVGEIDYRCVAETNELPRLTAQQAATRTWRPDGALWEEIKRRSVAAPAVLRIEGASGLEPDKVVSKGEVRFRTSKDPVGAPVFFRDVPLMPAQLEKGVIRPLPKSALPLVAWRLRYVSETSSRTLIENMPTCANCHSFSRDGKTLGMDLDGPQNDKGLYALVKIQPQSSIRNEDVVAWSSFKGKLGAKIRVGFMSQVSPDGRFVVTMVNGSDFGRESLGESAQGAVVSKDVQSNFYVANFKDYRFLQVFYPTRGILAWYSRETGKLQPLPGADDPKYVHTNATWSPDGKELIFARAEAKDPYRPGSPLAKEANDPEETPLKYDLYRIPFNEGRGGVAVPISGASANGMSNSFPKVSPDGKWIVYVQARNGLLMRPDSELHIVPAAGGTPRRMTANTERMNSWHSFSPNGRWLVFSSKRRSPYTQMYLTHVDENGNDTPPILVENATAANRAVNIPEFVNVPLDGWLKIDTPATKFYRLSDSALELRQQGRTGEALAEIGRALALEPNDAAALSTRGVLLSDAGRMEEAMRELRRAIEIAPDNPITYNNLGVVLARTGQYKEAEPQFLKALEINPSDSRANTAFGGVLVQMGEAERALPYLRKSLDMNPGDTDALNNLGGALGRAGKYDEAVSLLREAIQGEPNSPEINYNLGRALAAMGKPEEGIRFVEKADQISGGGVVQIVDRLSALYAEAGEFEMAARTARRAMEAAEKSGDAAAASALKARAAEYEAKTKR